MTLEAYSSLSLSAGSAVAAAAGRGALWAIGLYMREPLRNTALAALVGLLGMAGSNVLYRQTHHVPAPLFGAFSESAAPISKSARTTRPVLPLARPSKLEIDTETTGSLAPATSASGATIGNDDVLALQKKLTLLNFFSGTQDGLFGPKTSRAIKAFEHSIGRAPRGQLTPQIIALVQQTAVPTTKPVQPIPVPVAPRVALEPLASTAAALNGVAPMSIEPIASESAIPSVQPTSLPAPAPLVARSASQSTRSASDEVAPAAKPSDDSDEASSSVTATMAMNDSPVMSKRVVQTIAIRAQTGQPLPSQISPAQQSGDPATDPDVVAEVQRGLNSLGFLHGEIDGVAGDATAKAIRNFEVYYNYDVTGRVTRQLVNLLRQNGAVI